jgi:hypothetical protein
VDILPVPQAADRSRQQYKLYSTGELYHVSRDPRVAESRDDGSKQRRPGTIASGLDSLPTDSPPPFKLRMAKFKLESEGKL